MPVPSGIYQTSLRLIPLEHRPGIKVEIHKENGGFQCSAEKGRNQVMEYICHRMNRREELKKVPEGCGVEIDLRDGPDGKIYLEHNPFSQGEDFEEYIKAYAGKGFGTMILNVKSERIEHHALELMEKYRIEDFFFLDSTFPMVKLLSDTGENRIALRYSDWEGLDTLHHMKGKVGWAWVDCFDKFPLCEDSIRMLREDGYRICIVSPELQGQQEKLEEYAELGI